MENHRFHGMLVQLGTRTVRLPTEEELKNLLVEYQPFAAIDEVMPEVNDIIRIEGFDGEWLATHVGANRDTGYNISNVLSQPRERGASIAFLSAKNHTAYCIF